MLNEPVNQSSYEASVKLGSGWIILSSLLFMASILQVYDSINTINHSKLGEGYVGYILLYQTKLNLVKNLVEIVGWLCLLFKLRISILILAFNPIFYFCLAVNGFFITDDPYGLISGMMYISVSFLFSLILYRLVWIINPSNY